MLQTDTDVNPFVTLIIPAHNEERRLPMTLKQVRSFFDAQGPHYEVIVVDDGSSDRTSDVAAFAAGTWAQLRIIKGAHRGKGGAIRVGVFASRGKFVAIADVAMSMPVQEFTKFDADVFFQCDVAIATREGLGARRYNESILRHLMGRVFNALVQATVLPGFRDTHSGFQVLPRDVAIRLCHRQTVDGWGFDIEWLVIALRLGYRVGEVPIDWYHDGQESRISPIRDSIRMTRELWNVRRNLLRGIYDADAIDAQPSQWKEIERVLAITHGGR